MNSPLSSDQEKLLIQAIINAEAGTSGEIRIHFNRICSGDSLAEAKKVFLKLGMQKTKYRNAVLIYISLDSRKVAILGDEGIHHVVSQDFWDSELQTITTYFAKNQFLEGLTKAVFDIGEKLKMYFPAESKNQDELPNDITIS